MTKEELSQARKERWPVKLKRLGRRNEPYIGLVTLDSRGEWWFRGQSGSESISVKVNPRDLSLVRKEE